MAVKLDPTTYSGVPLLPLVQHLLDTVSLCGMSTVNLDGTAHINTVFFCIDRDWCMYFVSDKGATHSLNLAARPSLAVAVYDSTQAWDDWKTGVQLFGTCSVLHGRDARRAAALYKRRFPAYAKWLHSLGLVVGDESVPAFFQFVPHSLKLLCEESLGEEVFVSVRLTRE